MSGGSLGKIGHVLACLYSPVRSQVAATVYFYLSRTSCGTNDAGGGQPGMPSFSSSNAAFAFHRQWSRPATSKPGNHVPFMVIIILCSIYAGVLFASPIKREIGTENLCHWVNEEECDEIATQLLKNSSCGWNRIKVNRSSADELCSDAVTVVKMIREIIEELMKNRNLMSDDGQNVCNYETSTVAYFLKENEQCWSAENASQTIVHAYVYLTRIVLKHLSVANPIEQIKRYEVLLAKLDELRCSFWCFGHNTYEFESEAREDVLVELRNLDPLPSPDVNDTQVRFHECRVLTKLDAKVEEIKRHWEKNVEKC